MAFWGIEVKPGKPYTHPFDDERGKLHLSQATLGTGSSTKRSVLQCNVGDKRPVYLCSLLPEKFENCPLNLEFEGEDGVIFSVIGPHSIHLSGLFISETQDAGRDDYESDSYGEDIAETESDESTDYNSEDEYDDDFIVEDLDIYPPSPIPNSGVVIEEILDDENPDDENAIAKRGKKKFRLSNFDNNGTPDHQLVLKSDNGASILESEDEDGLPISSPLKNKVDAPSIKGKEVEKKDVKADDESKKATKDDHARVENLKRKVDSILQGGVQKSSIVNRETSTQLDSSLASPEAVPEADNKKKKNKKKSKEKKTIDADTGSKRNGQSEVATTDMEQDQSVQEEHDDKDLDINADSMAEEKKKKKKKKKKKSKKQKSNVDTDQSVPDNIGSTKDMEEKTRSKPFQVRYFPNGLVIEELAMGKPDGKKASPGKKVSVQYIGKLKKSGGIFDSNVGKAPFKFRLGIGQVIKGWDVGVNGMRVGDKRRLTIPPAMGYGAEGAGRTVPPNAWLVFDVELVEVL